MVPRPDSPGLGFGLPLIGRVADRVELSSVDDHGTEVCMRFGLSEHGWAGRGPCDPGVGRRLWNALL